MLKRVYLFFFTATFILPLSALKAQTIGGNSTFNFLKLSNAPQVSALGGINISNQNKDASPAFNNPALLRDSMHTQLTAVFNSFFAGIGNYHVYYVHHSEKVNTNFAAGVNFFNYGKTTQTDAAGNMLGNFRPVDYVVQLSAAQHFKEQWHYGITLKYISSSYAQYKSNGIAADFGVTYTDEKNLLQIGFTAKNMGTQINAYGLQKEDLPFDVQLGISKRLEKIPLQFSITAHHLHQFDIRYADTSFDTNPLVENNTHKKFTADKILRHLVFATQFYIGDKIELSLGYNHLRRSELKISTAGNGLNGLSAGLGVLFNKIQLRYARAYYQNTSAYNQLGISIKMNEYFNFSK